MHYEELNRIQKEKMSLISKQSYTMSWENPEFMNYLLGELPQIKRSQNDDKLKKEVFELESLLSSYNPFLSDKDCMLKQVDAILTDITKKSDSWYGLNLYEIESIFKLHQFCLISGEGGIGKSFFIKCFEEQLAKKSIPHLCMYGKFEKYTNDIDVGQIIRESTSGFVFIFDAVNEMSEEGQKSLIDILTKLKGFSPIRIVLTYRTNSMDALILDRIKGLAEYEYKFPGVSFESALHEIIKMSVPDVYLYEDILYSNNALLLSMLCKLLSSEQIVNEELNGVASVTYILEQFIKKSLDKLLWNDVKAIAHWMYINETKRIDEKSLNLVIKSGKMFPSTMKQMGFMDSYEGNDTRYFYFVIDSLTDYLIARSLFKDICNKDYAEQVEIIKAKSTSLYNIEEALIIAIFDKHNPDYNKIKKVLSDTKLHEQLDFTTLVKVHFKQNEIRLFQECFKPVNHDGLLAAFGGFTDKPFNCSNYLFDYYCSGSERVGELSNVLSDYRFKTGIIKRLRNVLYFTTLNDRVDRRDDEAFYFSLLCCASPNKDIRCLAIKLLYELASKDEGYIERVVHEYSRILDYYIQEGIIYVLSQLRQNNVIILNFFNKIINRQERLTAKSIRRISKYFGEPFSYITWNRDNLYRYDENASISDSLNEILFGVELMDKSSLPFRYWSRKHIEMSRCFLINDKQTIKRINEYLQKEYSCVRRGDCKGSLSFEKKIMSQIDSMADIVTMDMNSFMEGLGDTLQSVFEYYGVDSDWRSNNSREKDFYNSVYMKCVDLGIGFYYGSLMCNYYTNQFATYNNNQDSIGYEVYDPLEYGEEVMITAPIPTYQEFIEMLGDYAISSLEIPEIKDAKWARDKELTLRNVLHLVEPIYINKHEWVMLAGMISFHTEDIQYWGWRDTYNVWCCSSAKETIRDDGNARYLTIELEDFEGEIKSYPYNNYKPWLCKNVKSISSQSDVLDNTFLVLPPSEILRFFGLKLNVADLSWENNANEKIVICNNNKNSYYRDLIGGTVFMRKDYYDKFIEDHILKYFAFVEKFLPETGWADETSLHLEIDRGRITKEIKNNGKIGGWGEVVASCCKSCPHAEISGVDIKP